MPYELNTKIDAAIQKFGGDDDKYKADLKKNIRDYLGYSNYVGRLNKVTGTDPAVDMKGIDENLRGDLTPGAIQQAVGNTIDMRQSEISHLENLAGGVDVAGQRIAPTKAEAEKKKKEEQVAWLEKPKDWVDSEMADWLKNHTGREDYENVEQLRARLKQQLVGEGSDITPGLTEEEIDKRIDAQIPKEVQDLQMLKYEGMGYSEAEAKDLVNYERYGEGQMGYGEQKIYEMKNQTFAANARYFQQNKELAKDIVVRKDEATGQPVIDMTLTKLQEKYQDIPEENLRQMVEPSYRVVMLDDVKQFLGENEELQQAAKEGVPFPRILNANFMEEDDEGNEVKRYPVKEFVESLQYEYGDIYSSQEIEQIVYNYLMKGETVQEPVTPYRASLKGQPVNK